MNDKKRVRILYAINKEDCLLLVDSNCRDKRVEKIKKLWGQT